MLITALMAVGKVVVRDAEAKNELRISLEDGSVCAKKKKEKAPESE